MTGAVAILFANLKGNLGDLAILEANLRRLRDAYPGHGIDVWTSGFLKTDATRLEAFLRAGAPEFDLKGASPGHPMRRWRTPFRLAGLERRLQPWLIDRGRASFAPFAGTFAAYERVFVVGGDQFDAFASASMFGTLKAVAAVNPRLSAFPFSVNPRSATVNSPAVLREMLGLIEAPLLVRDRNTFDFLRANGLEVELGADSAVSLWPRVRVLPPSEGAPPVLVAVTRTSAGDDADIDRLLERLRPLGLPLGTLTTTPSADRGFLDRRASGVPYAAPDTWQDLASAFKSASLVITNRFHCALFAAMAGTAVLPVCNRAKVRAIAAEAGLPFLAGDPREVSAGLVGNLVGNPGSQTAAMERYLATASARRTAPV